MTMTKKLYFCPKCQTSIHPDCVALRHNPGMTKLVPSCSKCGEYLLTSTDPVDYTVFMPTLDQVRYLRHMNKKQHQKVEHALKQTIDIDTKLQIMEEMLLEKERKVTT